MAFDERCHGARLQSQDGRKFSPRVLTLRRIKLDDAGSIFAQVCQMLLDARRGDVADAGEATIGHNSPDTSGKLANVLFAGPVVCHRGCPIRDMLGKRALAVFAVWVCHIGLVTLGIADKFGKLLGACNLVREQLDDFAVHAPI